MIIHVGLLDNDLTDFNTLTSVSGSSEEVASSSINIGLTLKKALAIAILWACPYEIPTPFSPIIVSNPSSSSLTKSMAQALVNASLISSSVA